MRSNFASVKHSVLEFKCRLFYFLSYTTLVLAGDSSYISGNVSSPFFSAKNASVTAYILESFQARFKKCRLLFYNY